MLPPRGCDQCGNRRSSLDESGLGERDQNQIETMEPHESVAASDPKRTSSMSALGPVTGLVSLAQDSQDRDIATDDVPASVLWVGSVAFDGAQS